MEATPDIKNFIEEIIEEDLGGKSPVQTRFPPEPNGYLHIGHAKAMYVNFKMAEKFNGKCNLRFDDTNPAKEDVEYVDAIQEDIRWMGFEWDKLIFGSSYFDVCYEKAVLLIKKGLAYVDDLSRDEMREYRGTLTEPGKNSPHRDRSVETNLELFEKMKNGEFADGACTLRAKIDMASPNINLRDPALYRILHQIHHQTGDKWCIYPMYDFAHPIQDAVERITHSLCSLEYESHRPLYNWVVENCDFDNHPRQVEFARLNMTNTIMSKRYLRRLVEENYVCGWDDPRMPTLCGMRRRGYTAFAIKDFLDRIGVAKADSVVDAAMLEHCVREDLNATAHRYMVVTKPLKVTITNMPDDFCEEVIIENLPNADAGAHKINIKKHIYIEREDFMEVPEKKFFRLKPDGEVRLKGAYIIKCVDFVKDSDGEIIEVLCTYDPETKSGMSDRKVKATIHWVPIHEAKPIVLNMYGNLMNDESADSEDFIDNLNAKSLEVLNGFAEPALLNCPHDMHFQFMRVGYFIKDSKTESYNCTVGLKDSYKPNKPA
ncbi:MAG: glutamine--tRNA ligase/YqeY domain fusion protein [Clostridiales bacterium]|nr:glutamine--tRNA ligase/YqeY domain fusion protein [Clostridiales bacterium]